MPNVVKININFINANQLKAKDNPHKNGIPNLIIASTREPITLTVLFNSILFPFNLNLVKLQI